MSSGFTPITDQVCLAKSSEDGNWYRAACILEADGAEYTMIFADHGFIESVATRNLLPISDALMELPFLANAARIEGWEEVEEADLNGVVDAYEELAVRVKGKDDTGTAIVEIPAKADELKRLKEKLKIKA